MNQSLDANHFALFMFLSLSQQAEGWAYMLKDKVNMRTKQLLNNYLNSAKSLYTHMQGQHDINDLLDDSEVWTKFMQLLLNSSLEDQQKLFLMIKETLEAQQEV
jgi:hypothetical protein